MTPAQVAVAEARSTPSVSAYAFFVVAIAVLLTPPLTLTAARFGRAADIEKFLQIVASVRHVPERCACANSS
jgi:BarA-like signal transduction histidine kinase